MVVPMTPLEELLQDRDITHERIALKRAYLQDEINDLNRIQAKIDKMMTDGCRN